MVNETRVTAEHFGRNTVLQEHVTRHGIPDAIFLQRYGEWWRALLGAMAHRSNSS